MILNLISNACDAIEEQRLQNKTEIEIQEQIEVCFDNAKKVFDL